MGMTPLPSTGRGGKRAWVYTHVPSRVSNPSYSPAPGSIPLELEPEPELTHHFSLTKPDLPPLSLNRRPAPEPESIHHLYLYPDP
jgi:hypothetical protein